MSSIFYKNPRLYDLMHSMVSRGFKKDKYRLITELIGVDKKVLELACGTCTIKKYLDPSCSYEGWDLNNKFINYGKKKGLNVKEKNVFDFMDYPKCDVILILDVLHHLSNNEELIKQAKNKCDLLIIAEPYECKIMIPKVALDFKKINSLTGWKKKLFVFFNKILGDSDGVNDHEALLNWNHDENSLRQFFKKQQANSITKIGSVLIATF